MKNKWTKWLYSLMIGLSLNLIGDTYVTLNGTDNYLSIPDAANMDFNYDTGSTGNQAMMISLWFKVPVDEEGMLFSRETGTGNQNGYYARITNTGVFDIQFKGWSGGESPNLTGTTVVDDDQWHHLALVLNETTLTLYIDGQVDVTTTDGGYNDGVNITSKLTLGADEDGDVYSDYLSGSINDFRIYMTDSVSSASTISSGFVNAVYQGEEPTTTNISMRARYPFDNNALTNSGTDNTFQTATLSGAALPAATDDFTYPNLLKFRYVMDDSNGSTTLADTSGNNLTSATLPGSVTLDGFSAEVTTEGQYMESGNINTDTNTITIAGWLKPQAGRTIGNDYSGIAVCRDNTASGLMLANVDANTAKLSGHWNNATYPITNVQVAKGSWNFVVMKVEPGKATFFAGPSFATDLSSQEDSNSAYNTTDLLTTFRFGMDNASNRSVLGNFRDFRIWNYTLDNAQVEQLFDAEKSAYLETQTYVSTTVTQPSNTAYQGTTLPILQMNVLMNGSTTPYTLTDMNATFTNFALMDDVTIYSTGTTNTFNLGTATAIGTMTDANTVNITTPTALNGGVNYFWIAGKINREATAGQTINADCTQITIDNGTPANQAVTSSASGLSIVEAFVHYWNFDETSGTTAADSIGAVDGTLTGNATFAPGKLNYAVVLDGDGDFVSYPSTAALTGSGPFSISVWVKTTSTTEGRIYGQRDENNFAGTVRLSSNASGNVVFTVYDTGSSQFTVTSTDLVNDGSWHHIVALRTETQAQLYIDGNLDGTAVLANSGSLNALKTSVGCDLREHNLANTSGAAYFNGSIDEVRTYQRALDLDEIQALTPAVGLELIRQDDLLSWTVEQEVGVSHYNVVESATGNILFTIQAGDAVYSVNLPIGTGDVELQVVDSTGFVQSFFPGEIAKIRLFLEPGWNLISLPFAAEANGLELWDWDQTNGQYLPVDAIEPLKAVWVYTETATEPIFTAEKSSKTWHLEQGWNLVGPAENMDAPTEFTIYSFTETYLETGILTVGEGYWLYSEEATTYQLP